jgi:transcriptional regulator with XRE-family HTH domain
MSINNQISDVMMRIGRNVRKHRLDKGFTQQNLAFYCGDMDRSTISNIERFNCNGVNICTLVKICVVLEIGIVELFNDE